MVNISIGAGVSGMTAAFRRLFPALPVASSLGDGDQLLVGQSGGSVASATLAQLRAALDPTGRSGLFYKPDALSPAFTKTSATTLSVKAGTRVECADKIVSFAASTNIVMSSLSAGTDYAIYVCTDGSARADANFSAPAGYTTANSRKIGGFHYALSNLNIDGTPAINAYSIWDLKYQPACPDPRGMVLVADRFWADIYLTGINALGGYTSTSVAGATIADGASPPLVPIRFGGNGGARYSSLTWFEANEVLGDAGKRLPTYAEFCALAYGVTEAQVSAADPVTTQHQAGLTSRWGIEQATGCQQIWGADLMFRPDGTAGWAWNAVVGGRGKLYLQNSAGLTAVVLGGWYMSGDKAGSRGAEFSETVWTASGSIGSRGVCSRLWQA